MTPEQTAMRAAAEVTFAEKFERLGDPDPTAAGKAAVDWLIREGWRPQPTLADRPGPRPNRANPEVQAAAVAEARAAIEAKRRALQASSKEAAKP